MLVLVVKDREVINIGNIKVKVSKAGGKERFKIYVDAPKEIKITRDNKNDQS